MRRGKKLVWLLAMAMILSTAQPAMAAGTESGQEAAEVTENDVTAAEEPEEADEEVNFEACGIAGTADGEAITIEADDNLTADSDEVLEDYLEFEASGESDSTANRHRLNAEEKEVYDYLKEQIQKIASGKLASTTIDLSDYNHMVYSAEELGVNEITDDNFDAVAEAADTKYDSSVNFNKICQSLFADLPYEFYWSKYHMAQYYYSYRYWPDQLEICISDVSFQVNDELAADADYTVDTSKTGKAAEAAATARDIVSSAAGLSDYAILNSYKEEICRRVSYDDAAADADIWELTDESPWQMINVFDNDDSTNVVCEGYSKAFKFLCDETDFTSDRIECRLVTGDLDGGGHMWNIVTMDDRKNYLADVTNSDEDSIGCEGGLFLNGYSGGSAESGYVFSIPGESDSTYVYDDDTLEIYTDEELTLSGKDYDPDWQAACDHSNQKLIHAEEATCTTDGYTGDLVCEYCGATISQGTEIPAEGHLSVDVEAREATYTSAGNTAGTKCSVCGEILSGCKTIAKKTLAAPVISSVVNTTSGLKVTWNKVAAAQKYVVYYKNSGDSSYAHAYATGTNYTIPASKLSSGRKCCVCVKAMLTENSRNVYSGNSSTQSVMYLAPVKPSALTNTSRGITVQWKKVTGAAGYKIYRKTGTGSFTLVTTITGGSTVSWTDTEVKAKNGVTCTYAVRAVYGSTLGAYTAASVLRLTGITAAAPTNSASKKMTVKWTPNTKAAGVQIQYSTSSTFASGNKTVTVKGSSTKSTVISSLTKGKTYYVRIRCYSGSTWSAWGNTVKVRIAK